MGITSTGDRIDVHTYLFRELEQRYGEEIEFIYPKHCAHRIFHDFARNEMVEEFLESDADVIWFLDSDVCPPYFVLDLITVHFDKWLLAGAPYPIWMPVSGQKDSAPRPLFTVYKGIDKVTDSNERGIYMSAVPKSGTEFVDGLATGCLFIKREVFSKYERPWFQFKYDDKTRKIRVGEDLDFALRMHDLGIQFFVDHSMVCNHYKRVNLLDVNNYAMEFANRQVLEYDREIRPNVDKAIKAASQAAYEKGLEDGRRTANKPKQTTSKSGLILPSHLT